MAIELAPHNIQVNAIAPGWFETDLTADFVTGVTVCVDGGYAVKLAKGQVDSTTRSAQYQRRAARSSDTMSLLALGVQINNLLDAQVALGLSPFPSAAWRSLICRDNLTIKQRTITTFVVDASLYM